jgi:hypothetical protein
MNIYEQLISTQRYHAAGDAPHIALRMSQAASPTSIKLAEFEYIQSIVSDRGLTRGFEIATGFGVSALAGGLGFRETGGMLVTMDAYVEEMVGDAGTYRTCGKTLYFEADGYQSVKYLIDMFDLGRFVRPRIGWSPDDVESILIEEFPDIKEKGLDFVFIDGGHFAEFVKRDLKAVQPFVGPGTCILLHDVFEGVFGKGFPYMIKEMFGKDYEVVVPYPEGFNLSLLEL